MCTAITSTNAEHKHTHYDHTKHVIVNGPYAKQLSTCNMYPSMKSSSRQPLLVHNRHRTSTQTQYNHQRRKAGGGHKSSRLREFSATTESEREHEQTEREHTVPGRDQCDQARTAHGSLHQTAAKTYTNTQRERPGTVQLPLVTAPPPSVRTPTPQLQCALHTRRSPDGTPGPRRRTHRVRWMESHICTTLANLTRHGRLLLP